jgi:hypothetical protein
MRYSRDGDRLLGNPPSIVVGRGTDQSVARMAFRSDSACCCAYLCDSPQLGLPSKLGLRDGRHVDNVSLSYNVSAHVNGSRRELQTHADLPVHQALCSGRESGTLHNDDGLLLVQLDATLRVSFQNLPDL